MKINIKKLLSGGDVTYSLPTINIYPQNRFGDYNKLDNTRVVIPFDKDLIKRTREYQLRMNLLKTNNPSEYNRLKMLEAVLLNPTSEMVSYVDNNGLIQTVPTTSGKLSGSDPVGEFVVGNAALNPVFKAIGTGLLYGAGRMGNNWARATLINRAMNSTKPVEYIINPETSVSLIVNKLQKHLLETDNTVPAYFGPKYDISDVVNPDGTVNIKTALRILKLVAKDLGVPNMQNRLESPVWHKTDPNTFLHTKQVTQRAYNMDTPTGYSKLDQVFAALGHDFGKMWAGEGHGPVGAGVLKLMFPGMSDNVYLAIYGHMKPIDLIKTTLGKYTKYADIGLNSPKLKSKLNRSSKSLFKDVNDMLVINNVLVKDLSKESFDLHIQKFNLLAGDHPKLINKFTKPIITYVDDDPAYYSLGEYYLPNWKKFYNITMYPNRLVENAETNAKVPRLAIRLKNDNIIGSYFNDSKKTYVAFNKPSNKLLVGLHEFISHGTDYAADPEYWSDLFYPTFMNFSGIQKLPWKEIRATVNEAKYQIFNKAQKYYNKKDLTQKEFHDFVDRLSDTDIAQSLYYKGKPINGYASDALNLLNSARSNRYDNYVTDRLRHAFKYGFVGAGAVSNINTLNKKGES